MSLGEGIAITGIAKVLGAIGGAAVGLLAVLRALRLPHNKLKQRVYTLEQELNEVKTSVAKNEQKLDALAKKLDEYHDDTRKDMQDMRNNELAAIRNWLMTIAQHAHFSQFTQNGQNGLQPKDE
jgi:chromosome segregation ATPase